MKQNIFMWLAILFAVAAVLTFAKGYYITGLVLIALFYVSYQLNKP